jgi:alpha 1,2-mannosyltransferase
LLRHEFVRVTLRSLIGRAGQQLDYWRDAITKAKGSIPPYPKGEFKGKGLVFTAGGREYFTSLYVNLRHIRDTLKSDIPIEVFYAGAGELSMEAIEHLEQEFGDVTVRNIYTVPGGPQEGTMKGYQIKAAAILLSKFKEIVFVDADNFILEDPASLFELKAYTQYGTVFWPDYCNMHANNVIAWDIFGLEAPKYWPVQQADKVTAWLDRCTSSHFTEIESGQIVINKKKAWKGLYLTAFVSANSDYFLKQAFKGDKQTFAFGFNATGTNYYKLKRVPESLGILSTVDGKRYFCGNTMLHRHPQTSTPLFLHRNGAKISNRYFDMSEVPRVWLYQATQQPGDSWGLMFNGELPPEYFIGTHSDGIQISCIHPESDKLITKKVDTKVCDACSSYCE